MHDPRESEDVNFPTVYAYCTLCTVHASTPLRRVCLEHVKDSPWICCREHDAAGQGAGGSGQRAAAEAEEGIIRCIWL